MGKRWDGERKRRGVRGERKMEVERVGGELEPSFQLSMQELAVYHGKQKLESIKQANAGLCP